MKKGFIPLVLNSQSSNRKSVVNSALMSSPSKVNIVAIKSAIVERIFRNFQSGSPEEIKDTTVSELRQMADSRDEKGQLISYARKLEGLARHASVHAAAVIIAPGDITDYVPLYDLVARKREPHVERIEGEVFRVDELDLEGRTITVERLLEGGLQVVKAKLPAVMRSWSSPTSVPRVGW